MRLGKNTKTVKAANCQGICVAIKEIGMEPNSITVKVGEYVQFNTADGKKHNISLGKGAGDATSQNAPHEHQGDYSSGEFGAGEAWRVQFKKAGTFRLHDDNNPKDNILVVVYEPGADLKIH